MTKEADDKFTLEIQGLRRPGRPPKVAAVDALDRARLKREGAKARKAKERTTKKLTHSAMTVWLPNEVMIGLKEYLRFKDLKLDDVIEKLVATQLLRKR